MKFNQARIVFHDYDIGLRYEEKRNGTKDWKFTSTKYFMSSYNCVI